jgi:serine/threonine protein kinase
MEELDLGQTIRGFVAGQKLFQRYLLRSILGRGGMGIVWRAFDEHLERDVALKFLPELVMHDKAVLDDLKRETKRNLDLTHHHIVRIYDFAQDDVSACISMEFVDGETLSALRIQRPDRVFTAEELAQPMSELCEALTYAHTRATIVHRDLKPANLMLTSKGILKVTDFGIARSLSDSISMLTMGRGVSGTLLYMSPQQLDGDRPSAADDIYSVGATIYELLTSKPPFYSGGVERQIHEKVPPPMSVRRTDLGITSSVAIPAHWEECVADCLAKDPTRRPPSAAALIGRLRGEPLPQATPAPPPAAALLPQSPRSTVTEPIPPIAASQKDPDRLRSNRGFYAATAVIGAVILAVGTYLALKSSNEAKAPSAQTTPTKLAAEPSPPPRTTPEPKPVASPSPSAVAIASPTPAPATATATATQTTAPVLSSSYSASAGYDPAIALVDMNRIFKEYSKTKDSEKKINEAKDAAKKEYDDRAENYKKALDEINKLNQQLDSPALSQDKKNSMSKDRDDKIANIKKMEREINEVRQTREQQLQAEAMRLREQIVKEMTQEIESLNGSKADLIFDRSGPSMSGVTFVLFAPNRSDVSDKVIAALNRKAYAPVTTTRGHPIGLVDMNRIFKEYNKTKDSEKTINDAKNTAKKEFDERADNYKKALDTINKLNQRLDSPALTANQKSVMAKDRDDKITNIKKMETEINEFRQTRERQLQEQALRMRDAIVKDITDAIGRGLEGNSNAVLFDVSGTSTNGVPVIVYHKGVPDFSGDVIVALNGKGAAKLQQAFANSKSLRFGAVDMNRFFKGWPETKVSEEKINAAKDAAKKEYDDRAAVYKKALDEINTLNKELDSATLSAQSKTAKAKERDSKIAAIKNMEREINDFRTQREKQLQDEAAKMREAIVVKLTAAVKSRGEVEGFNVVFDATGSSTNGVPLLVIPPGVPDLTDTLLRK